MRRGCWNLQTIATKPACYQDVVQLDLEEIRTGNLALQKRTSLMAAFTQQQGRATQAARDQGEALAVATIRVREYAAAMRDAGLSLQEHGGMAQEHGQALLAHKGLLDSYSGSLQQAHASTSILATSMSALGGAVQALASIPAAVVEGAKRAATLGLEAMGPAAFTTAMDRVQALFRVRKGMADAAVREADAGERRTSAAKQAVEVEFGRERVLGAPPPPETFTFIEACALTADLMAGRNELAELVDITGWASQRRWQGPDGMYPLWYFVPHVLGTPKTVRPSGEGLQTTNHYHGSAYTKKRLAMWIDREIQRSRHTGHPLVPGVFPVVA